jgi:lysophospholipase L1-like esterase
VINLGTNDYHNNIADATFQSIYETFLHKIRKVYPKARIFALRTFLGLKADPTLAAVKAVNDSNIKYVDTTGWLNFSDTNDGTHPSDAGHVKIANKLGPIIEAYLKTLASPAALKKQHKPTKKKKKSEPTR